MTRNEFVKLLEEKIEPNAEISFLVGDAHHQIFALLEVVDVCNMDVYDTGNFDRIGVIFEVEEDLMDY